MAGRPALISARFDGGEVEAKMRMAHAILRGRECNVLMVDARAGDDFGVTTTLYLQEVQEENGVLVAVCTEHYAEVTSSRFSSYHELQYAHAYGIDILPLKMAAVYPPRPPCGEAHPFDKHKRGMGRALVKAALLPSLLYEDCFFSSPEQIADKIQARLVRDVDHLSRHETVAAPEDAPRRSEPSISRCGRCRRVWHLPEPHNGVCPYCHVNVEIEMVEEVLPALLTSRPAGMQSADLPHIYDKANLVHDCLSELVLTHVTVAYASARQFWDNVGRALESSALRTITVENVEQALLEDGNLEELMRGNCLDIDGIRSRIRTRRRSVQAPAHSNPIKAALSGWIGFFAPAADTRYVCSVDIEGKGGLTMEFVEDPAGSFAAHFALHGYGGRTGSFANGTRAAAPGGG